MEFIDKTGHIFSQKSYNELPIGYNYETNNYIFWFNDEISINKLSIDTYYIIPIRPILKKKQNSIESIEIIAESDIYYLLSSASIQQQLSNNGNINKSIEFIEGSSDFKSKLTINDICIVSDEEYTMIPFYVIANAPSESTWTSSLLIHIKFNDNTDDIYCPITVGGEFYDENEILMINGKNLGVNLPKSIINAIYQYQLNNEITNEAVYAEKVKEYLLNINKLKFECGNYNSALNAIKWFGYGDKITLTKLLKIDNEFTDIYLRDKFNITNDVIKSFNTFASTTMLSLSLKDNEESDKSYEQNFNNDFWGEAKPIMIDLFNSIKEYSYDEKDIKFYAPYYKWIFSDMLIKMSYLKYYYKKYFLPIHLSIHTSAIEHQCFTNDIKLITSPFVKVCNKPQLCQEEIRVKFPSKSTQYLYTSEHYVDSNYNEFTNSWELGNNTSEQIYYINDLCVTIPITFESNTEGDKYFDCIFVLEKDGKAIYETHFNFAKTSTIDYKNLIIAPKIINSNQTINYWINKKFTLSVCCNGKWFQYTFKMAIPELQLLFGKLQYEYNNSLVRQVNYINNFKVDFQSYMYVPSLIDVNNLNFPKEVIDYGRKDIMMKFINQYKETPNIPNSDKYYNRIHYYKLFDADGNELEYYADTTDDELVALYKNFFNNNGEQLPGFDISTSDFKYDMYLMHDDFNTESYKDIISKDDLKDWKPRWYVIFISKDTLDAKKTPYDDIPVDYIDLSNFKLKYQKSDKKFLINRMKYIPSNGINQFNTDDIIVATINNVDLPFVLDLGSKWFITGFSLNMDSDCTVDSNTNTALIGIGGDNVGYSKGYYNISVNYSIDGYTQQTITKKHAILVK